MQPLPDGHSSKYWLFTNVTWGISLTSGPISPLLGCQVIKSSKSYQLTYNMTSSSDCSSMRWYHVWLKCQLKKKMPKLIFWQISLRVGRLHSLCSFCLLQTLNYSLFLAGTQNSDLNLSYNKLITIENFDLLNYILVFQRLW